MPSTQGEAKLRRLGPLHSTLVGLRVSARSGAAPETLHDIATVAIDGGTPESVAIAGCIPQFCYGALELTPALQTALKVGHDMAVGFTPKDHPPVTVPVPLAGVTAALAALEQTGS